MFIGLENINPDNLARGQQAPEPRQRVPRTCSRPGARSAWSPTPATSWASRPTRPESIERDIRIIQRELPIDILEFFILTPLPGSADHKALYEKGVWMDPDLNKYDLEHACTHHPRMSADEWQAIYDAGLAPVLQPGARRDAAAPGEGLGRGDAGTWPGGIDLATTPATASSSSTRCSAASSAARSAPRAARAAAREPADFLSRNVSGKLSARMFRSTATPSGWSCCVARSSAIPTRANYTDAALSPEFTDLPILSVAA